MDLEFEWDPDKAAANAVPASSKSTPCLRAFAAALSGSHSNSRSMQPIYGQPSRAPGPQRLVGRAYRRAAALALALPSIAREERTAVMDLGDAATERRVALHLRQHVGQKEHLTITGSS